MALVRGEELLVEPRATAGDEDFELQWQRIERGEHGTSCCYDSKPCTRMQIRIFFPGMLQASYGQALDMISSSRGWFLYGSQVVVQVFLVILFTENRHIF